jgi:hypothetical protein
MQYAVERQNDTGRLTIPLIHHCQIIPSPTVRTSPLWLRLVAALVLVTSNAIGLDERENRE